MIYIIGDMHLSLGVDNKEMDVFGPKWKDHHITMKKNWLNKITEEDSVIHAGDFSWGINLEETLEDFKYLDALPGTKYFLKGNHEYWWNSVSKNLSFLKEHGIENIHFIQNNSYIIEDKIFGGTKGWQISKIFDEYANLRREGLRLKNSFEDMDKKLREYEKENGEGSSEKIEKIALLHYPPFITKEQRTQFKNVVSKEILSDLESKEKYNEKTEEEKKAEFDRILEEKMLEVDYISMMKKYGIKRCYYAHLHGPAFKNAITGMHEGIDFRLVSSDYIDFDPERID